MDRLNLESGRIEFDPVIIAHHVESWDARTPQDLRHDLAVGTLRIFDTAVTVRCAEEIPGRAPRRQDRARSQALIATDRPRDFHGLSEAARIRIRRQHLSFAPANDLGAQARPGFGRRLAAAG